MRLAGDPRLCLPRDASMRVVTASGQRSEVYEGEGGVVTSNGPSTGGVATGGESAATDPGVGTVTHDCECHGHPSVRFAGRMLNKPADWDTGFDSLLDHWFVADLPILNADGVSSTGPMGFNLKVQV